MFSCLCIVVIALMDCTAAESCLNPKTKFIRKSEYNDIKITESIEWTKSGLAKLECVQECDRETFCASVQYSPLDQTCTALRQGFAGQSVATVSEPGIRLYEVQKGLLGFSLRFICGSFFLFFLPPSQSSSVNYYTFWMEPRKKHVSRY